MGLGVWPEEERSSRVWPEDVGSARAMVEYQNRPIDFIVEHLGVPRATLVWSLNGYDGHRWDGTPDPLAALAQALADWEDVGVESGTGTGKSFIAGCLILWFLACFEGARVFTFAPKEDQLRLFIWTEIGKLWGRFSKLFPAAELTDLRIRMAGGHEWGATGYSVGVRAGEEVATKAAGMHAEHMLIVTEETPGIPKAVMAAHENTCTAPHNIRLALGNPDSTADTLHQFCVSPDVRHIRISALDHPNVVTGVETVPGAVGRKAVERRRVKYGEDSSMFESRVRGLAPSEAADALIKREWLNRAVVRFSDPAFRVGKKALGVDCADSEAGDKAAIARGMGACLLEVVDFACPDSNVLGADVAAEMKADNIDPQFVGVDGVGVGAGTVNELKRHKLYVQSLKGGPVPEIDEDVRRDDGVTVVQDEVYYNLRAQMHWQFRLDVQHDRIAIPNDPELIEDLLTPTWETRNGKIIVEAKEDIKARLGRSPNKGDAAVYWNWVRERKALKEPEVVLPATQYDAHFEKVIAQKNRESERIRKLVARKLREANREPKR